MTEVCAAEPCKPACGGMKQHAYCACRLDSIVLSRAHRPLPDSSPPAASSVALAVRAPRASTAQARPLKRRLQMQLAAAVGQSSVGAAHHLCGSKTAPDCRIGRGGGRGVGGMYGSYCYSYCCHDDVCSWLLSRVAVTGNQCSAVTVGNG